MGSLARVESLVLLVFEGIGPADLLILLVVIGIPAGVVWAMVQAASKSRKDEQLLTFQEVTPARLRRTIAGAGSLSERRSHR